MRPASQGCGRGSPASVPQRGGQASVLCALLRPPSLPFNSAAHASQGRTDQKAKGSERRSSIERAGKMGSTPPVAPSQKRCLLTAAIGILLRSRSPGAAHTRRQGPARCARGEWKVGPSPNVLHSSRPPGVTRADCCLSPQFPSMRTLSLIFRSEFLESIILHNGWKHVFTHKYHLNVSI